MARGEGEYWVSAGVSGWVLDNPWILITLELLDCRYRLNPSFLLRFSFIFVLSLSLS